MSKETRQQVAQAVKAVENKKGEELTILEMDRNSGAFTDYFVVCTGTNPRQIQAIADEVRTQLDKAGTRPNSVEGYSQAEWVLLDYVDFVVHVFSERSRRFYDLERLWKSATRLSPGDLLKKPAASAKKAAGRKTSAGARRKSPVSRTAKAAAGKRKNNRSRGKSKRA